jgi:hypothetical protein
VASYNEKEAEIVERIKKGELRFDPFPNVADSPRLVV